MTRPDGFWNNKTNRAAWTFESGARDYERSEIARFLAEKMREDDAADQPDRARYRWMDWLMVAVILAGAASITWCVAYGNGLPG